MLFFANIANPVYSNPITEIYLLRLGVLVTSIIITLYIVLWSIKSLSIKDRGVNLVKTGAFKYFRHPLYGAFLYSFNFGLAFFLNDYIFIFWAILQIPIWHLNIRKEETFMNSHFEEEYNKYCSNTSRFFPWKHLVSFIRK